MRNAMIAATAAFTLFAAGESFAQAVAVEIAPEQRAVIKEYVVKQKVSPARISGEVRVGAVLPADVELVAVPSAWGSGLTQYRYVYWNDRVVLVEPSSRKVIQVIN